MAIKFIKTTSTGNYKIDGGITALSGLKKLNIFVGKNNSGKSRFLRHLIINRKNLIDTRISDLYRETCKIQKDLAQTYPQVRDRGGFFIKELGDLITLESQEFPKKLIELKNKVQTVAIGNGDTITSGISMKSIAIQLARTFSSSPFSKLEEKDNEVTYAYIPILRGLRPLIKDVSPVEKYKSEDCYKSRTQYDYFKEELGKDVLIFSGLDLYEQIRDMMLSSIRSERDFIENFEDFLSKHFFNDQEIILTPTKDRDVITISIGGNEKPIYDVGDGIQSIICNVFLAFKNKDKNLALFIEEPEIFLHPGMQRTLIEVLLRELDNIQIFVTTHSNHFLDLVYDYEDEVSVYSFEKIEDNFYIHDINKNRNIIDILGVRNSSVYLANCVIWVEGVSDRIYLRKLVELYKKEKNLSLKEDYHYAISEYGGSNIENFDFIPSEEEKEKVRVRSISDKNFIVADNDGNREKETTKGQRLKRMEELLGDSFYDGYIEVENLIPYRIYKPVISKLLSGDSGKLIKVKEEVSGIENKFDNKLEKEKIGTILKKYIIEKKSEKEPGYFLNNNIECLGEGKKYLADLIVKEIDESGITFDQLPDHTKKFVEKTVEFIQKNN